MEEHSYISYIKINGVPILPPIITENIRQEIMIYKQSAINIERKLAVLHNEKRFHDIYENQVGNESKDKQFREKEYNFKENLVPVNILIDSYKNRNESVEKIPQCSKPVDIKCSSKNEVNTASNTMLRSELATITNNIDHYLNETDSAKSENNTVSNTWRPQVPKTLNIIPLTLSNFNCKENEKHKGKELHKIENTPKLVRQGSYVLDTPSPVLLAHMQMELSSSTCTPCSEYIPTSHTNMIRQKKWNTADTKIEWKHEIKNKESLPIESLKYLSMQKRNSYLNTGHVMHKSLSLQTKPRSLFTSTYSFTKSVDCIQAMLAQEDMNTNNIQINYDKRYNANTNNKKRFRSQRWKKWNSFSSFDLAYRFSGSLENLDNINVSSEYTKCPNASTKSDLTTEIYENVDIQNSVSYMKSSIASDKLLIVYKKVQEMHKKQMAELMSRQQKEQLLLQQEFEKQQLLLLTEIKKSFPELSVSLLSENILSPISNLDTCNNEKLFENIDNGIQSPTNLESDLQQKDQVECVQSSNKKKVGCPADYNNSGVNYGTKLCFFKDSQLIEPLTTKSLFKSNDFMTENKGSSIQINNTNNHKKELAKRSESCKRLNVSRQLFALDSKTTHVPVLEKAMYETKHLEAATIINAYARGYLVRRLMQTERVVALKNTYKEALNCMLKLHVDAPLNRSEFDFLQRLQLQCDAASTNIVELFLQSSEKRMQIIAQDREIKQSRIERPTSARSYSFATQRTLARKKLKEMEELQPTSFVRTCLSRSRCQSWTSDVKEKLISPNILYHSIKRSTSAGTVRKPWR